MLFLFHFCSLSAIRVFSPILFHPLISLSCFFFLPLSLSLPPILFLFHSCSLSAIRFFSPVLFLPQSLSFLFCFCNYLFNSCSVSATIFSPVLFLLLFLSFLYCFCHNLSPPVLFLLLSLSFLFCFCHYLILFCSVSAFVSSFTILFLALSTPLPNLFLLPSLLLLFCFCHYLCLSYCSQSMFVNLSKAAKEEKVFFFIAVTEEVSWSTVLLSPFQSLFVFLSIFFFCCFFYFAFSLSALPCYLSAYLSILCFLLFRLLFRHLFLLLLRIFTYI
jgi:hypothetical protein